MSDFDVKIDNKNLKKLIKSLSNVGYQGKVGILGANNRGDSENNATIGARHEFGSEGLPQRSFLRMPVMMKLKQELGNRGAFGDNVAKDLIEKGDGKNLIEKICMVAVNVIFDAFDSGGFGKWKPSNMKLKKNHQTLVETQQLRNSITYEVKKS